MKRSTKLKIFGAALLFSVLAASTGVVLSQGTPGSQSDKQPCANHPCEGYAYIVQYDLKDGRINAARTWDLNLEGPVHPDAAFGPQPGMATVLIADPEGRQMMKDVFENANTQGYYVDVGTLTLKKRAEPAAIPSATAESSAWPFGLGVIPPLAIASGIGLSVLAVTRSSRRAS